MSDPGAVEDWRTRLRKAVAYARLWAEFRPFWGGTLLLLAGLAMAFMPLVAAGALPFAVGSFTGSAVLFAVLLVLCGLSALTFPRLSSVVGLSGMLVSVLSVFGALGGYLVGSFFGGVGGLLTFAWRPPTVEEIKSKYGTVEGDPADATLGAESDEGGAATGGDRDGVGASAGNGTGATEE
jgi:hypothetical protein